VLDHERRQAAFDALRDACRPVIVVADRPPEHVHPGDHLTLDVHVVSDAYRHRDMVLLPISRSERSDGMPGRGAEPSSRCVVRRPLEIDVPGSVHLSRQPDPGPTRRSRWSSTCTSWPPAWTSANHYGTWVVGGATIPAHDREVRTPQPPMGSFWPGASGRSVAHPRSLVAHPEVCS
jgi:hypothetical protein